MITAAEAKRIAKETLTQERKNEIETEIGARISAAAKAGELCVVVSDFAHKLPSVEKNFLSALLEVKGFNFQRSGPTQLISWS